MNCERTTKIKILKMMIDAEVTSAMIAKHCIVDRSFVSHVISGRAKTPRIREAIATFLNVQVEEIWPV